jgi:MPBQ/MSBQ methyltransferase
MATSTANPTIVGVLEKQQQARRAVGELRKAVCTEDQIGVVCQNPDGAAANEWDLKVEDPQNIESSYDGSRSMFRLLRLETWGSPLMNLGYFYFRGPLAWVNALSGMAAAQHRLVLQSIQLLNVQPGHQVLDVACGRGKSSFILHCLNPDARVVGMDLLPRHTAVAQTLYGNARNLSYITGDALTLDFPDGSLDRLMCLEAAFHFPDRAQFLRESFRVLTPGGRLVVVDFAWSTDADRACRDDPATRLVRDIWQWDDFATVAEYQRMATAAGLRMAANHDWTNRVTRPVVAQLGYVAALAKSSLGRALLRWKNPLYRSFTSDDWHDCIISASAQAHVVNHSKYMAFIFEKP